MHRHSSRQRDFFAFDSAIRRAAARGVGLALQPFLGLSAGHVLGARGKRTGEQE